MPYLNFGPVLSVVVPFVVILLAVAVVAGGVYLGLVVFRRELARRRRRPAAPSSQRSMIVASLAGPILDGQELMEGDVLELRAGTRSGPQWLRCEVQKIKGVWSLVVPGGKVAVLAVGQKARWARPTPDKKEAELLRRLRRCAHRCQRKMEPDYCVTGCALYWEKKKLARQKHISEAVRKLL